MRALITGWRSALGDEQMPVYFVQLPGSGARDGWPYLREQQRLATDLPHTGMVVTVDIDAADIHPANKIDVGHRLALWALANDYGKQIAFSGPMLLQYDPGLPR
jgi:sialate O-acetylesterase